MEISREMAKGISLGGGAPRGFGRLGAGKGRGWDLAGMAEVLRFSLPRNGSGEAEEEWSLPEHVGLEYFSLLYWFSRDAITKCCRCVV